MNIRPLCTEDRPAWEPLWQAYLRFYRGEVAPEVTDQTFALMSERREGCFGLGACAPEGTLVGFTHCVTHRSTWSVGHTCYLEDLFVDPGQRGGDVGRALIEAAGDEARTQGAEVLYWHTQAFNGRARSLYDTVAHLTSFVHYEVELG